MSLGRNRFEMVDSAPNPEEQIARSDPDRYIAALFTAPTRRQGLIALYAFHHEVARIREIVHEPMVGHIRLGWWREQIAGIFDKRAPGGATSAALAQAVEMFGLPRALFDAYLDARGHDFDEVPFADEASLENYTAATAGSLMQLAARICGADGRVDAVARGAALAAAYAGYIRSLAFDAALRRCRLPLAWLEAEGLNAEDVFVARPSAALGRVVTRLADAAQLHLRAARRERLPTSAIAALAPAALVPRYLGRRPRDAFGGTRDIVQAERVARIALAVLLWRI